MNAIPETDAEKRSFCKYVTANLITDPAFAARLSRSQFPAPPADPYANLNAGSLNAQLRYLDDPEREKVLSDRARRFSTAAELLNSDADLVDALLSSGRTAEEGILILTNDAQRRFDGGDDELCVQFASKAAMMSFLAGVRSGRFRHSFGARFGSSSGEYIPTSVSTAEADLTAGGIVNAEKAKAAFAASADLQTEFGGEKEYLAFLNASAKGQHKFRR